QRIGQDLARQYPGSNQDVGATVAGTGLLPPDIQALATGFVGVLFALVGLILLIACANVAGMLIARGADRAKELAVRVALGAERARILRLLAMESALLAAGGCAAGLTLAYIAVDLMRTLLPVLPVALAFDLRLDWRVVAFSVAASGVATVVMGLVPALQAARTDVATAMKPDIGGRARRFGLWQTFVLAQVALSVLVVVCALMLGRSLRAAASIDPGFQASGVDLIGIELNLGGYTQATGPSFADRLLARAAQLPGVQAVGSSRVPPLMMQGFSKSALWPADSPGDERTMFGADWNLVTPGYFAALRIPVVRGRSLTDADRAGAGEVAVVNETLVRRLWPTEDPIGRTFTYSPRRGEYAQIQVVGIARDAKYRSLGETPRPHLYVPLAQHYHPEMYLMVRRDGRTAIPAMRALIRELDPALPVTMASTLSEAAAVGLVPNTLAAWVSGAAGAVGVLLAALGVYGITAYTVSRRTREIGVRVALGAQRAQVLRLVLGQSVTLSVAGAAIGLALAAGAARLLTTLLFGVTPLDLISFMGGAMAFVILAFAASLLPSRRALAIDPVEALRAQ
ncbi:MAG TPA: FtsX-like permease family protein, partial [Candidatus Limnocylindrales bacterium]|nr:FtsX-like permease family protein [Candidatus Limnocylindrales bacterium]